MSEHVPTIPASAAVPQVDVEAVWSTPFNEALWEQLTETWVDATNRLPTSRVESWRAEFSRPTGPLLLVAGPLLPLRDEKRVITANAFVIGGPGDQVIRWRLLADEAPAKKPPDSITAHDTTFGGQAALARFFSVLWKDVGPPVAQHIVDFVADEGEWSCRAIPRRVTIDSPDVASMKLADQDMFVEQIGYRARSNSGNGISETSMIYNHAAKYFAVHIIANGVLDIRERWLTFADAVRDQVLAALFTHAEVPDANS
jgi:hypothetical protein